LVVSGYALSSVFRKIGKASPAAAIGSRSAVEDLSFVTVLCGLAVLCALIWAQGCVPNARPLIDYSAFVNVCQ
jgi:hypothetical protein